MESLIVLVALVVIIIPILAIAAFVRVQGLHEQLRAVPLQNLVARLYSLEQRLLAIEKTLSSAAPAATLSPTPVPQPAAPIARQVTPPPVIPTAPAEQPKREVFGVAPPVGVFAAPPLHTAMSQGSTPLDLETTIAARWFNRIGILALLVGVSFFLKYAFDNNWIGPAGRIAIGILLGAAMLPWSQWLLGRGYSYFSEGIAAVEWFERLREEPEMDYLSVRISYAGANLRRIEFSASGEHHAEIISKLQRSFA